MQYGCELLELVEGASTSSGLAGFAPQSAPEPAVLEEVVLVEAPVSLKEPWRLPVLVELVLVPEGTEARKP